MVKSAETRLAIQLPFLDGVSTIPTRSQIIEYLGMGVTDVLYERLLQQIQSGDRRTWKIIIDEFKREDEGPDHAWS